MPDILVYVIFFNFVQRLFFRPSSKNVHKTAILRNTKIKSCVDFDTWEFPVSFLRVSNGLNILCTLHEHCFQGKNSFENPLTNTALGTQITREPCSAMLLCFCLCLKLAPQLQCGQIIFSKIHQFFSKSCWFGLFLKIEKKLVLSQLFLTKMCKLLNEKSPIFKIFEKFI